jgi:uncharacterized membrane protein
MAKQKKTKGQTMIYKTLHRKLLIGLSFLHSTFVVITTPGAHQISSQYIYIYLTLLLSYGNKHVCKMAIVLSSDNTMAKQKKTKGQTMIYKTLHRKLLIGLSNTNPTKK